MQAIPTRYAGVEFRSRLEADWAATMNALGVAWQYEPEGYRLPSGAWYSPDFWLPDVRAWLEVKGSHNERLSLVTEFEAALWAESSCTDRGEPDAPLVLIGREGRYIGGLVHVDCFITMQAVRCSAWFARCSGCHRVTAYVPGARACRVCRRPVRWETIEHPDGVEFTDEREFVRLPRPAGRAAAS